MRLIITKLSTGIPLQLIEEEIESGKLSEAMSKCGTQGFNIGIIENSDFDWIVELSTKIENAHEIAQAETETKIQEILESNVEVIEKGFQLVNKDSVLPPNSGIPDLICKDKIGNFVVIELKAGEASYHALGQAISYKGAIKKRTGGLVRAIVIGYSFDPKILFAKVLKDSDGLQLVEFKRYGLKAEILDN
jgi:RecB family endonuclease NucS